MRTARTDFPSNAEARELLAQAITASGLSARAFAEDILIRDERTVRRWISGRQDMPDIAIRYLVAWKAEPGRFPWDRSSATQELVRDLESRRQLAVDR